MIVLGMLGGKKATTYSISGNVFDGVSNVADVTVALGAYSATTDASGNYTISAVPAGTTGNLTATKSGYSFTAIAISALSGNLTAYNFVSPWYLYGGVSPSVCVAAYQPLGAANIAASYINLANPGTYDLTATAAPTFDAATGWTFNGSSQFLLTGIAVNSYNWGFLIRFSDGLTTDTRSIFGSRTDAAGNKRFGLFPALSGVAYFGNGANLALAATTYTSGVIGLSKATGYQNGSAVDGTIGAGDGISTHENYIGCQNYNGTASYFWAGKIQALPIYNAELTAPQVLAISTAMAALPYTAINQTYSSAIGV